MLILSADRFHFDYGKTDPQEEWAPNCRQADVYRSVCRAGRDQLPSSGAGPQVKGLRHRQPPESLPWFFLSHQMQSCLDKRHLFRAFIYQSLPRSVMDSEVENIL